MNTYTQASYHLTNIYQYQDNILLAKPLTWGIIFLVFVVITPMLIDMLATQQEGYNSSNSFDYHKNDNWNGNNQQNQYQTKNIINNKEDFFDEGLVLKEKKQNINPSTFLYTEANPVNSPFVQNKNDLQDNPFVENNNKQLIDNNNIEIKIYKRNRRKIKQETRDINDEKSNFLKNTDDVVITFD